MYHPYPCRLYTSDSADDPSRVVLSGTRTVSVNINQTIHQYHSSIRVVSISCCRLCYFGAAVAVGTTVSCGGGGVVVVEVVVYAAVVAYVDVYVALMF